MPNKPTDALLACPFCGDTASIERFSTWVTVLCSNCNAQTACTSDDSEAIKAWNLRTLASQGAE